VNTDRDAPTSPLGLPVHESFPPARFCVAESTVGSDLALGVGRTGAPLGGVACATAAVRDGVTLVLVRRRQRARG
jgi:hypothetical protein